MTRQPAAIVVPIFLLAALVAIAPLAIDAYLPAMPAMAQGLAVSIHDVELSLSFFLAGLSIGQIVGGPFSDHFGRRAAIFTGGILFALGSIGILFSSGIDTLWLFRIVEALGAGLIVVNSPAIVRDLSEGQQSARYLSHMSVIMMMMPLVAPLLGVSILKIAPWQGIFLFLLLYSLILLVTVYFTLPETRVVHEQRLSVWQRYQQILVHRRAMGFVLAQCFSFGGMFAFITASPLVYMNYFGISQEIYPLLFGANVIAMVIINRVNVWLLRFRHSQQLLSFGQVVQVLLGCLLLAYIILTSTPSLVVTACLIISFIGMQSFIVSNSTANTVEFFPRNSGTAAALLGASSFMTGALSGSLVGLLGDGTPRPMAMIMCACAILGLAGRFVLQYKTADSAATRV